MTGASARAENDVVDSSIPEEVLLDENAEAEKHSFYMVRVPRPRGTRMQLRPTPRPRLRPLHPPDLWYPPSLSPSPGDRAGM